VVIEICIKCPKGPALFNVADIQQQGAFWSDVTVNTKYKGVEVLELAFTSIYIYI
jgi:hypothetical protein